MAKKKPTKKRAAPRKQITRKPKRTSQELVIRVQQAPAIPSSSQIATPMVDGGKYMIPKTWVSEKQALRLLQKTPPQYIYKRPAKGGGIWEYVPGFYVEKVLNFTFGWVWDIETVNEPTPSEIIALIEHKIDQLWVTDKLTVRDDAGHSITKTQTGRADIKFRRNSRQPLDIGNDLKAAHTDALKKCASLLGIASDVYGKQGYREESGQEPVQDAPEPQTTEYTDQGQKNAPRGREAVKTTPVEDVSLKQGKVIGPDGQPTYLCSNCEAIITDQESAYSLKLFRKRLCRACQKNK